MRKTLMTTTALAMTAGAAAAEIGITGAAEMGVAGGTDTSARFHTDIQATFTMSGATDGGLTYGTAIDLSEVGTQAGAKNAAGHGVDSATGNDDDDGGIAINIAGPFGTLTMGDTDGAFDWAMTETGVGGSLRDNHTGHSGYNGNSGLDGAHDGQILSYSLTAGDMGFAVSTELDDSGKGSAVMGIGAKYSTAMAGGSVGVGIGYQTGGIMRNIAKPGKAAGMKAASYKNSKGPTCIGGSNSRVPAKTIRDYVDKPGDFTTDCPYMMVPTNPSDEDANIIGASVNFAGAGGISGILNWSRESRSGGGLVANTKNYTAAVPDPDGAGPREAVPAKAEGGRMFIYEEDTTHIGVGVGYTAGQMTVGVNWGRTETDQMFDSGLMTDDGEPRPANQRIATGVGIAANYKLGAGTTLQLGLGCGSTDVMSTGPATLGEPGGGTRKEIPGERKVKPTDSKNTWSLGLAFSF